MADAHEASGQDVPEEAVQELVGRQGGDFAAVTIGAVAVMEADLAMVTRAGVNY
jgi:hypothetical protein